MKQLIYTIAAGLLAFAGTTSIAHFVESTRHLS